MSHATYLALEIVGVIVILLLLLFLLSLVVLSGGMFRYRRAYRRGFEMRLPAPVPEPELAPVALGASAPPTVKGGDEFTARFVAYVEDMEGEVELMLQKMSPRSQSHMGVKRCRWRVGTHVRVKVYADHLAVAPQDQDFVWDGRFNVLDFDVVVSATVPESVTVLKFDVSIVGFVVARLRLDLEITANTTASNRKSTRSQAATDAFASYASEDRLRVLDRLSEIRRGGLDVFVDCLSLHPGEEWKPKIQSEIEQRDLFLLFWSIHAKRSEWVTWEWRTALQHKGLQGIDPHPLDPVFEAEPPDELKALHFGDPYMLARKAYEEHS